MTASSGGHGGQTADDSKTICRLVKQWEWRSKCRRELASNQVLANRPHPSRIEISSWFAAHPGRSHRLRRAFAGEWPGDEKHSVIRQTALGERLQLPIFIADELMQRELPKAAAWALFDLTREAQENGGHPVPAAEVLARLVAIERQLGLRELSTPVEF
jgi:hypothetical protein